MAVTAPYGHSGSYASLRAVIEHHLDPQELAAIAAANELKPISLQPGEVDQIIAFLETLTDRDSLKGRLSVPAQVPSGLPVDQ